MTFRQGEVSLDGPRLVSARSLADDTEVALTRRTPQFAKLAAATDRLLQDAGLEVPTSAVDELLNMHVDAVAQVLGVSARSALVHAPDSVPHTLLAEVTAVVVGDRDRPAPRLVAG